MAEPKKLGRPPLSREGRISRERVRQIQENALRKARRRLLLKGITKIDDLI
jgi:DNA-directed RNA polymerase sigma subunit (sigma70/sigma32)